MEQFDTPFSRHLKRDARQLRKNHPQLKQHQALDQVARQNGFENWRHLVNSESIDTHCFTSVIETTWVDDQRQHWRESIELKLTHDLAELYPRPGHRHNIWEKAWLDKASNRVCIPARLYNGFAAPMRQTMARGQVAGIARYLMYVDATGLRPSFAWRTAFAGFPEPFRDQMRLPCFDHEKLWRDEQGRYLFTTEPYDYRRQEQWGQLQEIAEARNYDLALVDWQGLHNPSQTPGRGTRLIVLSHRTRGVPLGEVLRKLNAIPNLHLPDQEWQGRTLRL